MAESDNEYVILGNDALMKCEIPSFVSDLVQIQSWIIDNQDLHKDSPGRRPFDSRFLDSRTFDRQK